MPIYDAGFKDGAISGYELAKKDMSPILDIVQQHIDLWDDDGMLEELRIAMAQIPNILKEEKANAR